MMDGTTKAAPTAANEIMEKVLGKVTNNSLDKQVAFSIHTDSISENLEIPIDGLLPDIQRIITSVADCYGCSRDIVTSSVFCAVGTAVGKLITIRDGKFTNYMAFWLCHVARSGSNKSQPVKWVLQPLIDADRKNYLLYKNEYDAWKIEGGTESGEPKPVFHQHLLCDSTPEARNKVLSDNPNGILLYRDEVKGLLDDFGRYNKSGEVAQMLSIFDATDVTINRKSDEPLLLERPYLSLIGGIQPSILADAFGKEQLMGNGFVPRWLFVYPDDTPPIPYRDCTIDEGVTRMWSNLITHLADFDFSQIDNEMLLCGGAKEIYIDYYNECQNKIGESDDYMAAVYSKLQILVIRWAGVAQLLSQNKIQKEIMPLTMQYSVSCMRYFERSAKKVYDVLKSRESGSEPLTKERLLAYVCNSFEVKNKQLLADALGQERSAVSRAANKYPMLRCYCYGGTQSPYSKDFELKNSVTSDNVAI
jgi:hypothetical protein